MVFLIGLDPISFPVGGSFLGCDITNFLHGRELHAICPMFSFSTRHVVGNAYIHQLVALVTLILVGVSFLSHS